MSVEDTHVTKPLDHIFSVEAREDLIATVYSLSSHLLRTYPVELPDIILPETSGRMMWQLFEPIIATVALARNVAMPRTYAVLISASTDTDFTAGLEIARRRSLSVTEALENSLNNPEAYSSEESLSLIHTAAVRDRAKQQAARIREMQGGDKKPLIILDDKVDTGTLSREIVEALGETIPTYVLCTSSKHGDLSDLHVIEGSDHGSLALFIVSSYRKSVFSGVRKGISTEGLSLTEVQRTPNEQHLYRVYQSDLAEVSQQVIVQLHEANLI